MDDRTDRLAERYDLLEHRFFDAVAAGTGPTRLVREAEKLREAAKAWETESYRRFFELRDSLGPHDRAVVQAEIEAEVVEAVHELWSDLQSAWAGKSPPVRTVVRQRCIAIAEGIAEGSVAPYVGAKQIWGLLSEEDRQYPDELVGFVAHASEWEDNPDLREVVKADIVAEAQELVRRWKSADGER